MGERKKNTEKERDETKEERWNGRKRGMKTNREMTKRKRQEINEGERKGMKERRIQIKIYVTKRKRDVMKKKIEIRRKRWWQSER